MRVVLNRLDRRLGSGLATELLKRGHTVTWIVRGRDSIKTRTGIPLKRGEGSSQSFSHSYSLATMLS
jgi:putative NADH-flavin reductase